MKKLFLMTALATVFLASCSQDEDVVQPTVDNNTIAFVAKQPDGKILTRSGQTINSVSKFTVSAVNADKTSYFNSVEFKYDNFSSQFKSETPYYWPLNGALSFYAISNPGTVSLDVNNVPKYTYSNWGGETDLVAATVLAGTKQTPYPLSFQHVLSQIVISAEAANKTEMLTYKLLEVELAAPCNGTYSFANATGGAGTWDISNSTEKTYSYASSLPKSFDQSGSASSGKVYWNILPLKTGSLKFKVGYQVFQNDKMVADYTGSKAKTCEVVNPNLVSGNI